MGWSASGVLITEAFASTFPTVIAYIIDTPRCQNQQTFVLNMLQACSILYKTCLPLVLTFNKCDIVGYDFLIDWIDNFDRFGETLACDESYSLSFSRSLFIILNEFYQDLPHLSLSAKTGLNLNRFLRSINIATEEYFSYYLPNLKAQTKLKIQEKDNPITKIKSISVKNVKLNKSP